MASTPTRWGIISCGRISNDFCLALKMQKAEEHQIAAVAARSLEAAQQFAGKFNCSKAYGSYKDITEDNSIDIYYIGTIHPAHYDICHTLLSAGKNVLCEKPLTLNKKTSEVLVKLAKEKNVFFMEGFWSKWFPSWQKAQELLPSIGEARAVNVTFGFKSSGSGRINEAELGGGSLLDIGCYCCLFTQHVFGPEAPEKVTCSGQLVNGVDVQTTIALQYKNNKMATCQTSVLAQLSNTAYVFGEKGQIKLLAPWHAATQVQLNDDQAFNFPLPGKKEPNMVHVNSEGFVYEQQHVRECLLKGLKESPVMPLSQTLVIMEILDECRRQIGMVYPHEK